MPALLKALVVPPLFKMPLFVPFASVQVDPARLLMMPPFCTRIFTPVVAACVVGPVTLRVRRSTRGGRVGMLKPALALVMPGRVMVPPVQVKRPPTLTEAEPLSVPLEKFKAAAAAVPPALLKFAVPP